MILLPQMLIGRAHDQGPDLGFLNFSVKTLFGLHIQRLPYRELLHLDFTCFFLQISLKVLCDTTHFNLKGLNWRSGSSGRVPALQA
jgi:hypothetical protein